MAKILLFSKKGAQKKSNDAEKKQSQGDDVARFGLNFPLQLHLGWWENGFCSLFCMLTPCFARFA